MSRCKKCDGPTLAEMADELEAKALKEIRAVVGSVLGISHFDGRARDVLAALRIVEHLRAASAMSAFGQDPKGLEAKPASATAKPGRPMTVAQLARDSAE